MQAASSRTGPRRQVATTGGLSGSGVAAVLLRFDNGDMMVGACSSCSIPPTDHRGQLGWRMLSSVEAKPRMVDRESRRGPPVSGSGRPLAGTLRRRDRGSATSRQKDSVAEVVGGRVAILGQLGPLFIRRCKRLEQSMQHREVVSASAAARAVLDLVVPGMTAGLTDRIRRRLRTWNVPHDRVDRASGSARPGIPDPGSDPRPAVSLGTTPGMCWCSRPWICASSRATPGSGRRPRPRPCCSPSFFPHPGEPVPSNRAGKSSSTSVARATAVSGSGSRSGSKVSASRARFHWVMAGWLLVGVAAAVVDRAEHRVRSRRRS